jgi:predicted amidophosphoribosyltransferase
MVLLLLVILAVLIWTIQVELEPAKKAEELVYVVCPACQHSVDIDLMVCSHCQQQLREACPNCHRGKMINHHYCPFCGTDQKRAG